VIARVILLEKEKAAAGESVLAQFVLESPTAALHKDRFIIRAFSPVATIGGGEILDTSPARHRRFDSQALAAISNWEAPLEAVVEQEFRKFSPKTLAAADIARRLGKNIHDIQETFLNLAGRGAIVPIPPRKEEYLLTADGEMLREKTLGFVNEYFRTNPQRQFFPLADLRARFVPALSDDLFRWILDILSDQGSLIRQDNLIGLPGHAAVVSTEDVEKAALIENAFRRARFEVPLEDDVRRELKLTPTAFNKLMHALIRDGKLVRIDAKVTYHRDFLEKARAAVEDHLRTKGGITIAELRDRLRVSRKYACALVEYFDRVGLTRRFGDRHVPKG
jgi:selenocysteine-specific elongation factor